MFDHPHLVRIENLLRLVLEQTEATLERVTKVYQRQEKLMANIDDIEADEAKLRDSIGKLITLAGQMLAELQTLASSPVVPAAVQAKIDDLHAKFTSDLNDVTSAISADSTPIIPPPATGPQPAPTISDVEPASGVAGDQVTITGSAFTGATGLDFGNAPVASTDFHVTSDTSIMATVPAGGSGRVTVTTSAGVSNAGTFAYNQPAPPAQPPFQPSANG
jgi:hypothetical protein